MRFNNILHFYVEEFSPLSQLAVVSRRLLIQRV
jgi:hypothetical protein